MTKSKTSFFCQQCGYQSAKWVGKCPSCDQWNTLIEEVITKSSTSTQSWQELQPNTTKNKPQPIDDINFTTQQRTNTKDPELNRVLGGGIVSGAVILLGGEPGIGKSTLMLQIALSLKNNNILYVTGEESAQQIKMRADRMQTTSSKCHILTETNTQNIFHQINQAPPDILVIDSIQTLHSQKVESAPGTVSQVKQCTAELIQFAKITNTPIFLIGHITKEGAIAGPKVLEHMVDTVLQFEGDRHLTYRIIRTTKNRFGPTSELGIYEMIGTGLRQVTNPSEILISQREGLISGISIGATIEGNRPLMIEIQALVSTATYGTPQRTSTGYDSKRLNMLLAVLEKRSGYQLGSQDIFINIAGGLKVQDPAIDLAICVAIVSSYEEKPISDKIAFAAEVGLGGELRATSHIDQRIAEAEKLGFDTIYISKYNQKAVQYNKYKINIKFFSKITELFQELIK